MNTDNLNIIPLSQSQANKDVTINEAFRILDLSAGVLPFNIYNGNNTMTEDQARHGVIHLFSPSGLTSTATIILPTTVKNAMTFLFSQDSDEQVYVKKGATGGSTLLCGPTTINYKIILAIVYLTTGSAPTVYAINVRDGN